MQYKFWSQDGLYKELHGYGQKEAASNLRRVRVLQESWDKDMRVAPLDGWWTVSMVGASAFMMKAHVAILMPSDNASQGAIHPVHWNGTADRSFTRKRYLEPADIDPSWVVIVFSGSTYVHTEV